MQFELRRVFKNCLNCTRFLKKSQPCLIFSKIVAINWPYGMFLHETKKKANKQDWFSYSSNAFLTSQNAKWNLKFIKVIVDGFLFPTFHTFCFHLSHTRWPFLKFNSFCSLFRTIQWAVGRLWELYLQLNLLNYWWFIFSFRCIIRFFFIDIFISYSS